MIRKFLMAFYALTVFLISKAQETSVALNTNSTSLAAEKPADTEKKPLLTITGSADAYWRYDFAKTKANNYTSFTGIA